MGDINASAAFAANQASTSFMGKIAVEVTKGIVPVRSQMLTALETLKTDPSNPQLLTEVQLASSEYAILNSTLSGVLNGIKQTNLGIANHLS